MMTGSSPATIRELRTGAKEARGVKLNRLGNLLDTIANIAQMRHDGVDPIDATIELDNLVEFGARVARDLVRTMPPEAVAS